MPFAWAPAVAQAPPLASGMSHPIPVPAAAADVAAVVHVAVAVVVPALGSNGRTSAAEAPGIQPPPAR